MNTKLHLTLLQFDITWEAVSNNLNRIDEILQERKHSTDLLVLPEMFATGFLEDPSRVSWDDQQVVLDWMKQRAAGLNAVVTGSHPFLHEGKYTNRLLLVYPNGSIRHYDKRHLFSMGGEACRYQAGSTRLILEVCGWKICPLVCYDLRFPVWSRNTSGFDLLLYVANWPAERRKAWNTLLPARAIENQCYVAGVNRTGNDGKGIVYAGASQVINSYGEELVRLDAQEQLVEVVLDKETLVNHRVTFPVLKDRDAFDLK